MGVLTESMTRLRDEIVMLRRSRQALRTELVNSTRFRQSEMAALRRAVACDLVGARRAWSQVASLRRGATMPPPPEPQHVPALPPRARPLKKRKKH